MSGEEIQTLIDVKDRLDQVLDDTFVFRNLYEKWNGDSAFVESAHLDVDVQTAAPSAGDLDVGEMRYGDGTGPNGRDELFWSVDGQTVARVEADSIIS